MAQSWPMFAPSSPFDRSWHSSEGILRFPPAQPSQCVPSSAGIGEGVTLLRSRPSLSALEIVKAPRLFYPELTGRVRESPEFSIRHTGGDVNALRAVFLGELRLYGFSVDLRVALTDHLSGLFEQFQIATPGSSLEAFLILRRPRGRSHWHIDHYRPEALQFVSTLAGYPNTPFLLADDYDRAEFERYRQSISKRERECHGLSLDDEALYPLKAGMSLLAQSATPRFVAGDLLFKGDELLHASPVSSVSRLIFAMSAVTPRDE